ncbi:hypothetical protein BDW71DRAFT_59775 [Aspergillus fruticulosus]
MPTGSTVRPFLFFRNENAELLTQTLSFTSGLRVMVLCCGWRSSSAPCMFLHSRLDRSTWKRSWVLNGDSMAPCGLAGRKTWNALSGEEDQWKIMSSDLLRKEPICGRGNKTYRVLRTVGGEKAWPGLTPLPVKHKAVSTAVSSTCDRACRSKLTCPRTWPLYGVRSILPSPFFTVW